MPEQRTWNSTAIAKLTELLYVLANCPKAKAAALNSRLARVRARETWALHPKVSHVPSLIVRAIATGP